MVVKSVFDIRSFKDVKFGFTLRYIEIRNHFFKISPPPPPCASKSFCMYMCYHNLHIVWKCADFLQNYVFKKINHPRPPSECQTVWIQIKTDILLVFIWVQTVCKRLLADDKIIHWHAKSYNR